MQRDIWPIPVLQLSPYLAARQLVIQYDIDLLEAIVTSSALVYWRDSGSNMPTVVSSSKGGHITARPVVSYSIVNDHIGTSLSMAVAAGPHSKIIWLPMLPPGAWKIGQARPIPNGSDAVNDTIVGTATGQLRPGPGLDGVMIYVPRLSLMGPRAPRDSPALQL
ncbi:hypothetical protein RF11_00906 [Thelohanellus kitauei]|uniref:Uncharacterized protein n=1 Tax=Thelohanellus kitauei TaxID=669202 RepID=A0A0C2MMH6_THEKT|nr:hypothetical protein RF11_00906 [Thelohanellus kitauei]